MTVHSSVVLGYSGLHGSERFRRNWLGPGHRISILRRFQGQDAAAALIVDGHLVAAVQEERFSGRKFDGEFPVQAIRWCLAEAGLQPDDVTHVAHNFDYSTIRGSAGTESYDGTLFREVLAPERQSAHITDFCPGLLDSAEFIPTRHHLAHAAAAHSAAGSPDDAAVLIVDGLGEVESTTIFHALNGRLRRVRSLGPGSSIGIFYSLVTEHLGYLGNSDEYKVMGLAPYGDASRFAEAMQEAVRLTPRGIAVPVLDWSDGEHRYARTLEWLSTMTSTERQEGDPLLAEHIDLAAALQYRTVQALAHLVDTAVEITGTRRVVLGGGVALNCAAVGEIAASRSLDMLFVPPAPGDDGTAIGAAISASRHLGRDVVWPMLPLVGPSPGSMADLVEPHLVLANDDLVRVIASMIEREAVVGWVQGAMEFGPRALGSRSILASPRHAATRDRVNELVKEREQFRPLAPVVLRDALHDWFEVPDGVNTSHMTTTVTARLARRSEISAVVHVDGTSRVQSLRDSDQPLLAALVREFARLTGIPMLLNTSLNLRGMPIARTAADAMRVFDESKLDALVMGNSVWLKPAWQTKVDEGHEVLA